MKIRSSTRRRGAKSADSAPSVGRSDRVDDQLITNFHNDSQFELSVVIQEVFGNRGRDKKGRHATGRLCIALWGNFEVENGTNSRQTRNVNEDGQTLFLGGGCSRADLTGAVIFGCQRGSLGWVFFSPCCVFLLLKVLFLATNCCDTLRRSSKGKDVGIISFTWSSGIDLKF